MEKLLGVLQNSGQRFLLQTYSALDRYYRQKNGRTYFFLTDAPLAFLATLFDEIEYRGTNESDAVAQLDGAEAYFQCVDSLDRPPPRSFTVQHLYFDFSLGRFLDPLGVYPDLRARSLVLRGEAASSLDALRDAALLISRYGLDYDPGLFDPAPETPVLPVYEQRLLLSGLMSSAHPEKGLALLLDTGFIDRHWPELAAMCAVPQTKDHHPEGHVFAHVLEAFKYRKPGGPALSLAILLHDLGKTVAEPTRENPYPDHADRGAILARKFLKRLEFAPALIEDTAFLIRHHMMPEALPRMPLYRIAGLLASPLFPDLLELYRSDLLSTFRGPEKYYEACRLYRSYLKKSGNPYKAFEGRKPISAGSRVKNGPPAPRPK